MQTGEIPAECHHCLPPEQVVTQRLTNEQRRQGELRRSFAGVNLHWFFARIVSLCSAADVKSFASQLPLFEDDNKTVWISGERDKHGSLLRGLINNELEIYFFNLPDLGGLSHKACVILGL